MSVIDDIAQDCAWPTPAPIGTTKDGLVGTVADLPHEIGVRVATRASVTLAVLAVAEQDGEIACRVVVDQAWQPRRPTRPRRCPTCPFPFVCGA